MRVRPGTCSLGQGSDRRLRAVDPGEAVGMDVNLQVVEGRRLGEVIPVKSRRFIIGRDESCQLRPKNPAISKQHCALIRRGQTLWVEDLGSTNGTLVNDRNLKQGDKVQVSNGDRL